MSCSNRKLKTSSPLGVRAYWLNWGIFWPGGPLGTSGISNAPDTFTTQEALSWFQGVDEVVYAFGMFGIVPQADGSFAPESPQNYSVYSMYPTKPKGASYPDDATIFSQLKALQAQGKKIIFAVGGWNFCQTGNKIGDFSHTYFHDMTSDPTKRTSFVQSLNDFVTGGGNNPLPGFKFDGVEFDWEYPGLTSNATSIADAANDFQNFQLLIRDLRKLNPNLSIALDVGPFLSGSINIDVLPNDQAIPNYPKSMKTNKDYFQWLSALAPDVDQILVMSYDFYAPAGPNLKTMPNAPLLPNDKCASSSLGESFKMTSRKSHTPPSKSAKSVKQSRCGCSAKKLALNTDPSCSQSTQNNYCLCSTPTWQPSPAQPDGYFYCPGVTPISQNPKAGLQTVTIGPFKSDFIASAFAPSGPQAIPFTVEEILCFFKNDLDLWKQNNPSAPTAGPLPADTSFKVCAHTYTVGTGDTLSDIANEFGITNIACGTTLAYEILAWNNIPPTGAGAHTIQNGQVLIIPAVPTLSWKSGVLGQSDPVTSDDCKNSPPGPGPTPGSVGVSLENSVCQILLAGVPANKMYCGLALYGHSYAGVKFDPNKPPQSCGLPAAGPLAGGFYSGDCGPENQGTLTYYEIANYIANTAPCCPNPIPELTSATDTETNTQVAYNTTAGVWVNYDTADTLKAKIDFLKSKGVKGVMAFAPAQDDFKNGYPLMNIIVKESKS